MKTLVKILLWTVAAVIGLPLLVLILSPLWRKPWIEPLPGVRLTPARPVIAEKDLPPDSAFMRFRKAEAAFVKAEKLGIDKEAFRAETIRLFLVPWSEEAFPLTAKLLGANDEALRLAREAAATPDAQVPSMTSLSDTSFSPSSSQDVIRLLDASAARQAGSASSEATLKDLQAAIQLGDMLSRGGCLINRLIDISEAAFSSRHMRLLTLQSHMPPDVASRAIADLRKLEENLEPWPETYRWELLAMHGEMRRVYSGVKRNSTRPRPRWSVLAISSLASLCGSSEENTQRNFENAYAHLIKFAETPEDSETPEKFLRNLEAKHHGPLAYLVVDDPIGFFLARLSLPVLDSVNASHVQRLVHLRATQAVIAIRQFQQANGRLPESLGELVPQFLPSVPEDPFDHKPLRYIRRSDTAWAVYSVGRNRIDDGGKEPKSNRSSDKREADLVFSSTEAADALAKLNAEKPAR